MIYKCTILMINFYKKLLLNFEGKVDTQFLKKLINLNTKVIIINLIKFEFFSISKKNANKNSSLLKILMQDKYSKISRYNFSTFIFCSDSNKRSFS